MSNTSSPTPSIAIIVSYVGPTDTRCSRVKIEIPRIKIKKSLSFDYSFTSCTDQIEDWLQKLNIKINAQAELDKGKHAFLVSFDDWAKLTNAFGKA